MTDHWAAFGIEIVTPTQLKTFAFEDVGAWYAKYGLPKEQRIFEDIGPAGWRGDATEAGLVWCLSGKKGDPLEHARKAYDARHSEWAAKHDGETHKDYDKHWIEVERALPRAITAWEKEKLPKPTTMQVGVSCFLPGGPNVKAYGKFDFGWGVKGKDGSTRDLKSTGRLPNMPKDGGDPEPNVEHGIQASIYGNARGDNETGLLYVSTADKPQRPYVHIVLDREKMAEYIRLAVQLMWRMDAFLEAAYALSLYKPITKLNALAELCRPNFRAEGGGTFPIYKAEFARAMRKAITAWDYDLEEAA